MKNENENKNSGIQRYSIPLKRSSSVHLITFEDVTRYDRIVRFVDLSVVGVGIVSKDPIKPGLVCFTEQVVGHKFGVITWCRQNGEDYRAGINFVTLPREQELYLLTQVKQSESHTALRDPDNIIAGLLKAIKPQSSG